MLEFTDYEHCRFVCVFIIFFDVIIITHITGFYRPKKYDCRIMRLKLSRREVYTDRFLSTPPSVIL